MRTLSIISYLPLLTGVLACFITYMVIPNIIRISRQKRLCDDPSVNQRKLHLYMTPNLGGIAIFAGVLFSFMISTFTHQPWVPFLTAGLIILFLSGVKDDINEIPPKKKLGFQIIAVMLIIVPNGIVISNLGGVFGVHQIPYWAGVILTTFTMIVVINAYNLIDGIDGLAGGIGIIACIFSLVGFGKSE